MRRMMRTGTLLLLGVAGVAVAAGLLLRGDDGGKPPSVPVPRKQIGSVKELPGVFPAETEKGPSLWMAVTAIDADTSGRFCVTGHESGVVLLREIGKPPCLVLRDPGPKDLSHRDVVFVKFLDGTKRIVLVTQPGTIEVLERLGDQKADPLAAEYEHRVLARMKDAHLYAADVSTDGRRLVVGVPLSFVATDGQLIYGSIKRGLGVWDLDAEKQIGVIPFGESDYGEIQVVLSPDARLCVSVNRGYVVLYDVANMKVVYSTPSAQSSDWQEFRYWQRTFIHGAAFLPEGREFLSLTAGDWPEPPRCAIHGLKVSLPVRIFRVTTVPRPTEPISWRFTTAPIIGALPDGSYLTKADGLGLYAFSPSTRQLVLVRETEVGHDYGAVTIMPGSWRVVWGDWQGEVFMKSVTPPPTTAPARTQPADGHGER